MDFLEDKYYSNRIKILESNFNNYNPNMQIYIKIIEINLMKRLEVGQKSMLV